MKKLFFVLLAILLIAGNAFAISIPQSESGTTGPAVVTIPVYNNLGSTMDAGDVAIWDIGSSTGDNDNWVTTTSTADTYLVACVVYPSDIAAGDVGTCAIRGVVPVDMSTTGVGAAGSVLCTSTTAGSAGNCAAATAIGAFGIVTTAVSGGSVNAMIKGIM
jgi:hypothetical protein